MCLCKAINVVIPTSRFIAWLRRQSMTMCLHPLKPSGYPCFLPFFHWRHDKAVFTRGNCLQLFLAAINLATCIAITRPQGKTEYCGECLGWALDLLIVYFFLKAFQNASWKCTSHATHLSIMRMQCIKQWLSHLPPVNDGCFITAQENKGIIIPGDQNALLSWDGAVNWRQVFRQHVIRCGRAILSHRFLYSYSIINAWGCL